MDLTVRVTAMALLYIASFAMAMFPTMNDGNAVPKMVGFFA